MTIKLLTEHNFEFLRLKAGCRGSSESTHVKLPHCWKSHALAQIIKYYFQQPLNSKWIRPIDKGGKLGQALRVYHFSNEILL